MANLSNLCKKYDITKEQIKEFTDFIYGKRSIGEWCGDFNILIAVTELLVYGDVEEE